jgi:hypothetical protein
VFDHSDFPLADRSEIPRGFGSIHAATEGVK